MVWIREFWEIGDFVGNIFLMNYRYPTRDFQIPQIADNPDYVTWLQGLGASGLVIIVIATFYYPTHFDIFRASIFFIDIYIA